MITISWSNNVRVFSALMRRDVYLLSKQTKDFIIDGLFIIVTRVTIFCYLFPVMGMPVHFVGPIYIGGIISLFFNFTHALVTRVVFDLKFNRLIDYHLILPIDGRWLWLQKVLGIALNIAFVTVPLVVGGFFVISAQIASMQLHLIACILVYTLSLFLCATFLLASAINYSYDWFMLNIWARRLTPLYTLGCALFPWKNVYTFSPVLGRLFLLNPVTYAAEGFRATLLGSEAFISYWICIPVLAVWCGLAWLFLMTSIKRRFSV